MSRWAGRFGAVAAVLFGALAFAVCLVAIYPSRSTIEFNTDAGLQTMARGFYPLERAGGLTYTWTGPQAEVAVAGLDRRIDWRWTGQAIIWRPAGVPLPTVRIAVDGIVALERTIERDLTRLEVAVPRRSGTTGVTLTIETVPGFVPSPQDSRELGIALESMSLKPVGGVPWPSRQALVGGTLAVLILGAALVAMRLPPMWVLACVMLTAVGQTWLITRGFAAYLPYPVHAGFVAFWLGSGALLVVWVLEKIQRKRIETAARGVVALSVLACYVKLLVLLHPGMSIGDGLFHAHRFEYVLAGHFYFTSLAPGDYSFPYPILLYVFAAPFSFLAPDTIDRVALLAHPSTYAILTTLLVLTAFLYRWRGGGQLLQDAARGVCVATPVAAVVAFVLYYAWFPAIYNSELSRAASEAATRAVQPSEAFPSKLAAMPDLAVASFGWPALVAAYGWSWAWRGPLALRIGAMIVGAATWIGVRQWTAMLA